MKYNFDKMPDRKNTNCIKWDFLETFFGKSDLNAFWVADMDFKSPPEILNQIKERAAHGVFGYTQASDEFYLSVESWFKKRFSWEISRDWVVITPGVVPALNLVIQEFTKHGDAIIIQPPVYFPFKDSIELNNRKVLTNPLILRNSRYETDWNDLERKAVEAEMLVFCSPHNPVSRVWTVEELDRLDEICEKNDLLLFSDEIHADIVFTPHRHSPTARHSESLAKRTVSAFSTSKTFNLAGLQLSVNIIPNDDLRQRFKLSLAKLHLNLPNIFGLTAAQAAYSFGEAWLEELISYLWQNYLTIRRYLNEKIPEISVIEPEGTFLLWLDCRKLELSDDSLAELFTRKAGLALSNGAVFGTGGTGFMRMNIACPRQNILRALGSLESAVATLR